MGGCLLSLTHRSAIDMLGLMLTFDPDKRISAADALQHPYFLKFRGLSVQINQVSCNTTGLVLLQ